MRRLLSWHRWLGHQFQRWKPLGLGCSAKETGAVIGCFLHFSPFRHVDLCRGVNFFFPAFPAMPQGTTGTAGTLKGVPVLLLHQAFKVRPVVLKGLQADRLRQFAQKEASTVRPGSLVKRGAFTSLFIHRIE